MGRSVAQGRPENPAADGPSDERTGPGIARWLAPATGLVLALAALAIYSVSHVDRYYAGMSVLLTSPAYLLAFAVVRRSGRSRLVTGAILATGLIAFVDLMHFSQGWVQFGYRFSNDAAPFAIVLVALGFERLAAGRRWGMLSAMTLVVLSLAITLWGVLWSRALGW